MYLGLENNNFISFFIIKYILLPPKKFNDGHDNKA
jgi:hypothetical protein